MTRLDRLARFIGGYTLRHGYGPSYAEMAAHIGVNKSKIGEQLDALKNMGLLRQHGSRVRGVEPVHPRAPDGAPLFFVSVP